MTIGEKIKLLRCRMGLTQDELASAAKTTKQTIHKYETGIISNIPASKIKAIADKLITTPAYLMGWEDKSTDTDLRTATVFNKNGIAGAHKIVADPQKLQSMNELLDAVRDLPAEKIQMLIQLADSMKK